MILIAVLDCLHDMGDPVGARLTSAVRSGRRGRAIVEPSPTTIGEQPESDGENR